MRAALAAVAGAAGVLAALAAAVLWTAGSVILDEDRFTERTVAALRTPEGQAAISARATAAVRGSAPVPEGLAAPAVREAVAGVVPTRAFAVAAAPAIRSARRSLLDRSGEAAAIDLATTRDLLAGRLAQIDPRLAGLLPAAGSAGDLRVATGVDARGLPADELSGRAPAATALLALAAAALIGLAVALAARPARAAAWAGAALLAGALVPVALRLALPPVAEDRVAPPDGALARRLAEGLLGGWAPATAALAAAGLALLVGGLLSARRRPRPRSLRRAA